MLLLSFSNNGRKKLLMFLYLNINEWIMNCFAFASAMCPKNKPLFRQVTDIFFLITICSPSPLNSQHFIFYSFFELPHKRQSPGSRFFLFSFLSLLSIAVLLYTYFSSLASSLTVHFSLL